jgi:hypothetical protein
MNSPLTGLAPLALALAALLIPSAAKAQQVIIEAPRQGPACLNGGRDEARRDLRDARRDAREAERDLDTAETRREAREATRDLDAARRDADAARRDLASRPAC